MAKDMHKLKGSILQVRYFDGKEDKTEIDNTLEVSNFPNDVSEDLVELYFENSKSGGRAGAVKSVTVMGSGIAQVQFSSSTSEYSIYHFCNLIPLTILSWKLYTDVS